MSESQLEFIAQTCDNARFHARIASGHPVLPAVRILAPRLKKIEFDELGLWINIGECTAAWNLCTNLEVLIAGRLTLEQFSAITNSPKYTLKKLRIHRYFYPEGALPQAEAVMNILAHLRNN